jgi:hypothetical protein
MTTVQQCRRPPRYRRAAAVRPIETVASTAIDPLRTFVLRRIVLSVVFPGVQNG